MRVHASIVHSCYIIYTLVQYGARPGSKTFQRHPTNIEWNNDELGPALDHSIIEVCRQVRATRSKKGEQMANILVPTNRQVVEGQFHRASAIGSAAPKRRSASVLHPSRLAQKLGQLWYTRRKSVPSTSAIMGNSSFA
jgi:hypothetical protein